MTDDLLLRPLLGSLGPLRDALLQSGCSPRLASSVAGLGLVAEGAVLTLLLAWFGSVLRNAAAAAPGSSPAFRKLVEAAYALAALGAAFLFYWLIRFPSPRIDQLLARWDHLAFSLLAGCVLGRLSLRGRMWGLSLLSACFVLSHTGVVAFTIVIGGAVVGFLLLRAPFARSARATAVTQGAVLACILLVAWQLRQDRFFDALLAQGLFAFVLLRHISFVVEVRRGLPSDLGGYLCYMLFYPYCIGASEIYGEFWERNLAGETHFDYASAARKIIVGGLLMWISGQMVTSFDHVLATSTAPLMWWGVLLLFVRSAFFLMGFWAVIEGVSLFYGFRVRPNFAGILSARNPAQFWHSWRATMTNWLVHYVYIPLGGNRRYQTRNIFAAFAVSTAWHCMGVSFFSQTFSPRHIVPIVLWGALNAAAVTIYVHSRRRGFRVLPERTPAVIRTGAKIFLTIGFGTFTVTLLGFMPQTIDRFPHFIRTLVGIGP